MRSRGILLGLGLLVLVVMLVCAARLKRQPASPPAARAVPAARPPAPVDLTRHDGETIDFSSGKPVVKTAPADQAALDQSLKEMADATKDVTFAPTAGATNAPPAPSKP